MTSTVEMTSHTRSVYSSFLEVGEDERRRQHVSKAWATTRANIAAEKAGREARRQRLRQAIKLHVASPEPSQIRHAYGVFARQRLSEKHVECLQRRDELRSKLLQMSQAELESWAVVRGMAEAEAEGIKVAALLKREDESDTVLKSLPVVGRIDLRDVLRSMGDEISEEDLSEMLREVGFWDSDDWVIRFEHFAAIAEGLDASETAPPTASQRWPAQHGPMAAQPDTRALASWMQSNGAAQEHRLSLLDSCRTREPWGNAEQFVSILEKLDADGRLKQFLAALPRTVEVPAQPRASRARVAKSLGFRADDALVVTDVVAGSAAARQGVERGLQLLRFGPHSVAGLRSFAQLVDAVRASPAPWVFRFSASAVGAFGFGELTDNNPHNASRARLPKEAVVDLRSLHARRDVFGQPTNAVTAAA